MARLGIRSAVLPLAPARRASPSLRPLFRIETMPLFSWHLFSIMLIVMLIICNVIFNCDAPRPGVLRAGAAASAPAPIPHARACPQSPARGRRGARLPPSRCETVETETEEERLAPCGSARAATVEEGTGRGRQEGATRRDEGGSEESRRREGRGGVLCPDPLEGGVCKHFLEDGEGEDCGPLHQAHDSQCILAHAVDEQGSKPLEQGEDNLWSAPGCSN